MVLPEELGVGCDNHLPGSFEDGTRSKTLPIGAVEGAIHFGEPAVAFHHEGWLSSFRAHSSL